MATGNTVNNVWRTYLNVSSSSSNTTTSVSFTAGLNIPHDGYTSKRSFTDTVSATSQTSVSGSIGAATRKGVLTLAIKSGTFYYNRTTSAYTIYVTSTLAGAGESTKSTVSVAVTIPARPSYSVTFKSDTTSGSQTYLTQTDFYYGYAKALSTSVPTKENYSFKGWTTTEQGTTVNYSKGQSVTLYGNLTLYPVWQEMYPPTCENNGIIDTGKSGQPYSDWKKNFSKITTTVSNIDIHEGRTLSEIRLVSKDVNTSAEDVATYTGTVETEHDIYVTPTTDGTKAITLYIKDSANLETSYYLGEITVNKATWKQTVTYANTFLPPDIDKFGNAVMKVYAKQNGSSTYDLITSSVKITQNANNWSFDVTLGESYVSDITSATPTSNIKVEYDNTVSVEKEYRKAFFNSTRNANYSTGISNTMFLSGCTSPNFASRVWWSYVNNPLYFPDINYVEVGSNDTSVMGLMKVGDYLGAVKQSKTTDTAIYLLYATSFDDDTTFAVKQGVQGVGALGKYSFNILGDETLFLSPNGIMAIVPSEDEEHKVQNRSYFVDGRLLSEEGLVDAYSFVFDGMYWLSTGDHCYVLDGNQKNSWGNDKTNLVYEAYYLDNIPASCFMKYNDKLWFSNESGVCRFKNEEDSGAYTDSYEVGTLEEFVPVKAEWSTILDDDGSLHYYKTMQKKGNVVSILPIDGEPYIPAIVTAEEFAEDKTKYYTLEEGVYVRCTEESVFVEGKQYYIVNHNTSAEVYLKKDSGEEIFVGEVNGLVETTGDIPNELHIKKKIKKYKRLQFIMRNNKSEGFGVDSIIKSYTLGNYSK